MKFVLTSNGKKLITRMVAGETKITFTKARASDKAYSDAEIENISAIEDVRQEVAISSMAKLDQKTVELTVALGNEELENGYLVKAIGIYAEDDGENEVLVGAATETAAPDPMPAFAGKEQAELEYKIAVIVESSDNVTVVVIPSAAVTEEEFEKEVKRIDSIEIAINGLSFSVTDKGTLAVTYDDGTEE